MTPEACDVLLANDTRLTVPPAPFASPSETRTLFDSVHNDYQPECSELMVIAWFSVRHQAPC